MSNASIALAAGEVKSAAGTPVAKADDLGQGRLSRPEVLGRMPKSCSVVFDTLRALEATEGIEVSIRQLAEAAQLSPAQTWRALRRLKGAHLIEWETSGPGRGGRSFVELNWHEVSFPQKNVSSKPVGNNPVTKRTSGGLYTQRYKDLTKEHLDGAKACNKTSSTNWKNNGFNYSHTHLNNADAPLWSDVAPWCTRRLWSSLAGQVRRRAAGLWGPYSDTATDALLSTAARAAKADLVESEDELRELIRYLGGRLRESGHAIEILRDRPRAFAFLGGVARRWLRRRGKLEAEPPETVAATDWPKWQKAAFEVLEELSWSWERRSKPLGDPASTAAIVGKGRRAWLSTPPERLHRRGWELVEAASLRGFDLEEARWLVIAGLASALGVPMPEPPRRRDTVDPTGITDPEAQRLAIRRILAGLAL